MYERRYLLNYHYLNAVSHDVNKVATAGSIAKEQSAKHLPNLGDGG